jgi:hypothetical protein
VDAPLLEDARESTRGAKVLSHAVGRVAPL